MAHSFIARFRIRPDKETEFIDLTREMEALAPSEPGTLSYKFYRLAEPGMFAVYESFVDAEADRVHMDYPHNKLLIERMIACMEGTYVREYLLDVDTPEAS